MTQAKKPAKVRLSDYKCKVGQKVTRKELAEMKAWLAKRAPERKL